MSGLDEILHLIISDLPLFILCHTLLLLGPYSIFICHLSGTQETNSNHSVFFPNIQSATPDKSMSLYR